MVRIAEIHGRDEKGEFSIAASIRQAQSNKQSELLKTVTKGNLYTGQIVDIRKGTYLIKLSNGVNALAHSSHCKKPVMRSDIVAFVVNFVDNKTMMATGNIIRIITENGDVRNIETLAGVGFINDAQKGDLIIHKRSSDKKLEGFSFRITGKIITGQEYDRTFTTDKDGIITVSGLRIGTYTVSEIADEATERYILPDDQTVDIRSKEVTDVEFYNDERVISFEITKSDISTGELIPGCGFRIRNADGDIVIEGYTDENGIAKVELVCGDYTYQEFDAPVGYIIDEKEYPFTINPDDTMVRICVRSLSVLTQVFAPQQQRSVLFMLLEK